MLIGAGALNATAEVIAVADKLGAGCAKALEKPVAAVAGLSGFEAV
jgi:1-aminocyclopropane-1-carboxylate deaminase/D-cysteine desulfhydrase-like pyridoxal-dependent ACC family enzyme